MISPRSALDRESMVPNTQTATLLKMARTKQVKDRTFKRSRHGCRNCKLRKLKCDEGKPGCHRCALFGIICNYNLKIPDLQPAASGAASYIEIPHTASPRPPPTHGVWTSDASSSFQLDSRCRDLIDRYLGRSLITPDDPILIQLNHNLLVLSFSHPYLMHASLAVAMAYDRYLTRSHNGRQTLEECYHWSHGTLLFNKRLQQPIDAKDKDPIWGTACALALLAYGAPGAHTPEASWPLKSTRAFDVDWLRISNGKMALWDIVNPLRPDSIFSTMAVAFAHMLAPLPQRGVNGIPKPLADLCQLTDSSSPETSFYFNAAHAVSRLIAIPDGEVTTGPTQLFTRTIHGAFEMLLQRRDPVALLLLYLWYHKAGRPIWWIDLRARVECPSIYAYLQVYHKENAAMQAFLAAGPYIDK